MGEKRNVYRLLVRKPEGKRPLGRPRRRWIDNIKMDLLEIKLNVVDWIGLAQDRYRWRALVNAGSIKCWDKRKGVILQLGESGVGLTTLTVKTSLL
jgi:hypothetical protein